MFGQTLGRSTRKMTNKKWSLGDAHYPAPSTQKNPFALNPKKHLGETT